MHRRLIALARGTGPSFFFAVGTLWIGGLLLLFQAWLLSNIVGGAFLEGHTLSQEMPRLWLLFMVVLIRAAISGLHEIGARAVAVRVKSDLRRRLFAHIQALGPLYTRGQRTGELTAVAVEGVEALDVYFSQFLPQIVITALIPLTILLFVLPRDSLSALVMLLTAPLIPFLMVLIGKGSEAVTHRQYQTLSRLSAHFLDSLQGLTTLQLLGRSRDYAQSIAQESDRYRRATLSVLRVTFLSAFVLELLTTISVAVIAVEVGLRLLYGRMLFPAAFFVLIIAPEFYLPFRMLGLRFHAGMSGLAAAERIFAILDRPPLCCPSAPGTRAPVRAVVLENVTFTYPGESQPALRQVNLRFVAGERVALIGPSGAGKSTLMGLLLGFLTPTEGRLWTEYADGNRVGGPPPAEYLAWVPQHPHLFHDTMEANLRLARPEATPAELEAALRAAHLSEFVRSLPQGLQTVIGEGGMRLSTGEAQRLALARAFLRDAPILILDEPTAFLDPQTEALLEAGTRRLFQDRTVVVIAHRIRTVRHADRIVVLDKGRVVEEGAPAELLVRKGEYARFVRVAAEEPPPPAEEIVPRPLPFPTPLPAPLPHVRWEAVEGGSESPRRQPILRRLWGFLRGYELPAFLSVLLGALTIGANVSLLGTSAWIIAMAALHPPLGYLQMAIVGVRFFGIARSVLRYAERLVSHNVTFHVLARLRVWFYRGLEPKSTAYLMTQRAGDLLARMVGDVETLENLFVRLVQPVLVAVLTVLGVGGFLWRYSPSLAAVMVGSFLAVGGLLPAWIQHLSRGTAREVISLHARMSTLLVDGIQGLADLLACDRVADWAGQIFEVDRDYARAQRRMARIGALHTSLSTLLANVALWGVICLTIPLISAGHLDGVMLGALGLIALAAFEAAIPLPQAAQIWESTLAATARLFEVVDAPPPVSASSRPNAPIRPRDRGLEIERLTFCYPGTAQPALEEVSFRVPVGATVAIVGPTGAGKSTLAHLLLRFWDYERGEIRLGGVSLKALPPDEARGYFAVIPPRPYIFNVTLRENLLLARPDASSQELEAAIRAARLEEVVARLPQGWETYLGEQGWRLSAGERQRLAIARALLQDRPILLMDEPTAHLDPVTEQEVLEVLLRLAEERTTIWITHRLVRMERVDEILVLDRGCIVERGAHAELIARNGLYRRMVELQRGGMGHISLSEERYADPEDPDERCATNTL